MRQKNNDAENWIIILVIIAIIICIACLYFNSKEAIENSLKEQRRKLLGRYNRLVKLIGLKELFIERIKKASRVTFKIILCLSFIVVLICYFILASIGVTTKSIDGLVATYAGTMTLASFFYTLVYHKVPNATEILFLMEKQTIRLFYKLYGKTDVQLSLIQNRNDAFLIENQINEIECQIKSLQNDSHNVQ